MAIKTSAFLTDRIISSYSKYGDMRQGKKVLEYVSSYICVVLAANFEKMWKNVVFSKIEVYFLLQPHFSHIFEECHFPYIQLHEASSAAPIITVRFSKMCVFAANGSFIESALSVSISDEWNSQVVIMYDVVRKNLLGLGKHVKGEKDTWILPLSKFELNCCIISKNVQKCGFGQINEINQC